MRESSVVVVVDFHVVDVSRIHQGRYISIFRSLPSLEVLHLICVSRTSYWSPTGPSMFMRGVIEAFGILDDWGHLYQVREKA